MSIEQQFKALEQAMEARFFRLKHGTAIKFGILRKKIDRIKLETKK